MLSATLIMAVALAIPDQVELSAKPGGKMTFAYNPPVWRDEFATALQEGQAWRFGSNGATTWTTAAGLIFDDLVVFPGEYNIAGIPSRGSWELVFHHDGINYGRKSSDGAATLAAVEVEDKEKADRLEVELEKDRKNKGTYTFRATFGPKRLEGNFKTAKAKSVKGKAGKVSFASEWLERTDVDELVKQLDEKEVGVARITVKGKDQPIRVFMRGGDSPSLRLVGPGELADAPSEKVSGQAGDATKPSKAMAHTVKAGDESAEFSFMIGEKEYHFSVPAEVMTSLLAKA